MTYVMTKPCPNLQTTTNQARAYRDCALRLWQTHLAGLAAWISHGPLPMSKQFASSYVSSGHAPHALRVPSALQRSPKSM
jgi:hypothetical protein